MCTKLITNTERKEVSVRPSVVHFISSSIGEESVRLTTISEMYNTKVTSVLNQQGVLSYIIHAVAAII